MPSVRDRTPAGVAEHHRARVDAVQPFLAPRHVRYYPDYHVLMVLARRSNIDKHRRPRNKMPVGKFVRRILALSLCFSFVSAVSSAVADNSNDRPITSFPMVVREHGALLDSDASGDLRWSLATYRRPGQPKDRPCIELASALAGSNSLFIGSPAFGVITRRE
jgi:hypothetical protein